MSDDRPAAVAERPTRQVFLPAELDPTVFDEAFLRQLERLMLVTRAAVRGGLDVPRYLGSASTFTLGRFGGHGGRALQAGDVLRPGNAEPVGAPAQTPAERRPAIVRDWEIGVTEGPHAAPDFFTRADIDELYSSVYTVHHNSARTGVRLMPKSCES